MAILRTVKHGNASARDDLRSLEEGVGFGPPHMSEEVLDEPRERPTRLPKAIYAHGSSIHSTLVQIAGSVGSALFVGIMSADADRLMAQGISKADAYASGFSHTLLIAIGILAIAFVASIVFVRIMRRKQGSAKK